MEPVMLNNRYQLLELVGSGGMAVVYRGLDTLLQRQVAIKVLRESFASDPAFLARFQREAQAAAKLDHPNVVTVYDVGQHGDRHYIVLEYVDGQDLKTLIRQRGRLNVDETLSLAIQISAGVGHAHKAGLIHCDVKPQNVLVTHDGRAKVADFGIARALSQSGLTESETVWGSPLYFSPEQAAGDPPSPASDVYSIGIIMYEMLAGQPPFQAEKATALALMHMREEPPSLYSRNPRVPPQLDWIVRKVLAKEPSARYCNADQLAYALNEYRSHGEQATGVRPAIPRPVIKPKSAPEPASPKALDRLTWVLGGIALVAVIGALLLWSRVYREYFDTQPATLPTPTSSFLTTLTPEVQTITVPNVVGKKIDEARREVERAGLRFVVLEERDEEGSEGGLVLDQSPIAGERAPLDSELSIIASRAGRELTMLDLVGYELEAVQDGLESDGLRIVVDPVWSAEVEGLILVQKPEPEAIIHSGDAVTLTVSGGADVRIPLGANLGGMILLESAELKPQTFKAGGAMNLTFYWKALQDVGAQHYVAFVHLIAVDPNGRHATLQDMEPRIPTTEWVPGMFIVDPRALTIPPDQPPGRYYLRTGMYPQGQPNSRLPVADPGSTEVDADTILIAEIEILP